MDKYRDVKDLANRWKEIVFLKDGSLKVNNAKKFRDKVGELAYNASVNSDPATAEAARWIIQAGAVELGCPPASIHELYMARGRGEVSGFTVPAHNLRGMIFDISRALFRTAKALDAGAFIFELARSEIGYTFVRPPEYSACVLAAAIREDWKGPVFIQGDHFQIAAKKYWKGGEEREKELQAIRDLIKEAVAANWLNIDIDASTVVELSRKTLDEQQRDNYENTAAFAKLVREQQPKGTTISIGGEIGEVGHKNSTPEELMAYMDGFLSRFGKAQPGVSKISVQTGTSHGGVPLPDGSVAQVKVDFDALAALSRTCREKYGISGAVQHGASTLPENAFFHFPRTETAEIHLATEFQNMVYEHPKFPPELKEKVYAWLRENTKDEFKADQTDAQNIYKTRKKGWGPFKDEFWRIPDKDAICASLEQKFTYLFGQLKAGGTRAAVEKYVKPQPVKPPPPAGFTL
jgi:fructose/tagatose bisphosphate aldolase